MNIKLRIPITRKIPIEPNGGVPVNIQDQVTPPELGYFTRVLSTFSLAENTVESGTTSGSLIYTFEASPGHNISIGSQIALVNSSASRKFYSYVKNVNNNTITIDRPIDYTFNKTTTTCAIINKDLRVNGSLTPIIYSICGVDIPADATGFCLHIVSTSEPSDELFGNITELSRGIAFRVYDSYHKTLGVVKNNGTLKDFGATVTYNDKAGGTNWSTVIFLPFKELWGVGFRIGANDCLQIVIQDDLTSSSLISAHASIIGHLTCGEV